MIDTLNYSLDMDKRTNWLSILNQMRSGDLLLQPTSFKYAKLGRFVCITIKADPATLDAFRSVFPPGLYSDL